MRVDLEMAHRGSGINIVRGWQASASVLDCSRKRPAPRAVVLAALAVAPVFVKRMISENAKALLRNHIESFEQLEILLLLHRRRSEILDSDAIATELKLDFDTVTEALAQFCRDHLAVRIEAEGRRFRYGPDRPGLDEAVGNLAESYDENRLEVINLMNTNAIDRVRTSAMRAFANSFLLGGGGKKNDG